MGELCVQPVQDIRLNVAPKKKAQKMALADFFADSSESPPFSLYKD